MSLLTRCITLHGIVEVDTELSVLMDIGRDTCVWIPKSVLSDDEGVSATYLEFTPGEEADWIVEKWWAQKNDIY